MKNLTILILVLLIPGCTFSVGSKVASIKTTKRAMAQVMQETKTTGVSTGQIKGEIVLTLDDKEVTGTIKADFKGQSEGELNPPGKIDEDETLRERESMILGLISLFSYLFILQILITWVCVKWIGGFFKNIAKRAISLIVAGLVVLGYVILTDYNNIDLIGMSVIALLCSNYIYDVAAKGGYKELIGIKV